jgi:hypothetical protein
MEWPIDPNMGPSQADVLTSVVFVLTSVVYV